MTTSRTCVSCSQRHCWIVQGVQRERHRPPYAYTVGLAAHGRPELVVTGLPYDRAVDLLNGVAEHVLHAEAPRAGEVIPLRGGPVPRSSGLPSRACTCRSPPRISGPGFAALQLVYADDRGHWPWDAGFRGGRGGQPVLGARAVPAQVHVTPRRSTGWTSRNITGGGACG